MVTIPSKGWAENPPEPDPQPTPASGCGHCEYLGDRGPCQEHQTDPKGNAFALWPSGLMTCELLGCNYLATFVLEWLRYEFIHNGMAHSVPHEQWQDFLKGLHS